jgi:PAS domain-containing protein
MAAYTYQDAPTGAAYIAGDVVGNVYEGYCARDNDSSALLTQGKSEHSKEGYNKECERASEHEGTVWEHSSLFDSFDIDEILHLSDASASSENSGSSDFGVSRLASLQAISSPDPLNGFRSGGSNHTLAERAEARQATEEDARGKDTDMWNSSSVDISPTIMADYIKAPVCFPSFHTLDVLQRQRQSPGTGADIGDEAGRFDELFSQLYVTAIGTGSELAIASLSALASSFTYAADGKPADTLHDLHCTQDEAGTVFGGLSASKPQAGSACGNCNKDESSSKYGIPSSASASQSFVSTRERTKAQPGSAMSLLPFHSHKDASLRLAFPSRWHSQLATYGASSTSRGWTPTPSDAITAVSNIDARGAFADFPNVGADAIVFDTASHLHLSTDANQVLGDSAPSVEPIAFGAPPSPSSHLGRGPQQKQREEEQGPVSVQRAFSGSEQNGRQQREKIGKDAYRWHHPPPKEEHLVSAQQEIVPDTLEEYRQSALAWHQLMLQELVHNASEHGASSAYDLSSLIREQHHQRALRKRKREKEEAQRSAQESSATEVMLPRQQRRQRGKSARHQQAAQQLQQQQDQEHNEHEQEQSQMVEHESVNLNDTFMPLFPSLDPDLLKMSELRNEDNAEAGLDLRKALLKVKFRSNALVRLGPVNASCALTITNISLPDHPIIYCSDAFCRLTGYTRKEVMSRNCRFLQSPTGQLEKGMPRMDTDPAAVYHLQRNIEKRRECQVSLLNYKKDGTPFINLVTIVPIDLADDGQPSHMVGLQVDLLERPDAVLKELTNGSYIVDYTNVATSENRS